MAAKRLIWVDIGMAIAAGIFIALVLFGRNSDAFVLMMTGFMVAMVVWAFVAELAAISAERADQETSWERVTRNHTEPITH